MPSDDPAMDRIEASAERRDALAKRLCAVMGWECTTAPLWAGIRKVAVAEAAAVGLDQLEEIIVRLEQP